MNGTTAMSAAAHCGMRLPSRQAPTAIGEQRRAPERQVAQALGSLTQPCVERAGGGRRGGDDRGLSARGRSPARRWRRPRPARVRRRAPVVGRRRGRRRRRGVGSSSGDDAAGSKAAVTMMRWRAEYFGWHDVSVRIGVGGVGEHAGLRRAARSWCRSPCRRSGRSSMVRMISSPGFSSSMSSNGAP